MRVHESVSDLGLLDLLRPAEVSQKQPRRDGVDNGWRAVAVASHSLDGLLESEDEECVRARRPLVHSRSGLCGAGGGAVGRVASRGSERARQANGQTESGMRKIERETERERERWRDG